VSSDGSWIDDFPEDWPRRRHELLKPGESIGCAIDILEFQDRMNSQEWYAANILQQIDIVRILLAVNDATYNDAASAASMATSLGANIAVASFKFAWEDDVVLGRIVRQGIRRGTEKSAQIRGEKSRRIELFGEKRLIAY